MDTPVNRMNKPGRKPEGSYQVADAPVAIIDRKVLPCVCPLCGKAQAPVVRSPQETFAYVNCSSCARRFQYIYATRENPTPRVRFERI